MPAKSKAQQKLFQLALAVRNGNIDRKDVNNTVLKIVDGDMTNEQIKDFTVLEKCYSSLKYFIECAYATPMNTLGMGNVNIDGGADAIVFCKPNKKKRKKKHMKSLKIYINEANEPKIKIGSFCRVNIGKENNSYHSEHIIYEEASEVNGFCVLKPEFLNHEEDWYKMIENAGWQIIQKKKFKMSKDIAQRLYEPHAKKDFYKALCDYMSSDECICCLCHKNCSDPIKDMKSLKNKCRDAWGKDEMKNAMHSSDSLENVERERKIIFENK